MDNNYEESDTNKVYLHYQTHVKEVKVDQDGNMCAYGEDFADAWSMGMGPPVIVDSNDNEVCRLPVKIPNHIYKRNERHIVPGRLITLWYGYNGSGVGDEFYVDEVRPTQNTPKRTCSNTTTFGRRGTPK